MIIRELQQIDIKKMQKDSKTKVFVIEQDEVTMGCIEMIYDKVSNFLEIRNLWVLEQYQRRGIARKLVKASKGYARFEKAEGITVIIEESNDNAIQFFLKEDFKVWPKNALLQQKATSVLLGFKFSDIYNS
ncbi:acetyltransferase [Clostridium aceticum]|uniref:Acetyltransferase n=1 Tax=Clostridium aceticum TaxID=84022 RepID=A0A0D8IEH1_9CLOT|nr:GNAT family N-acetyltransferase [Clostridium aceticum]AKL93869.1 acetyltransferase [Clostridium aceticum]KJF28735.1 hypothetical protein TZ02_02225 [Clostridium aceticum]